MCIPNVTRRSFDSKRCQLVRLSFSHQVETRNLVLATFGTAKQAFFTLKDHRYHVFLKTRIFSIALIRPHIDKSTKNLTDAKSTAKSRTIIELKSTLIRTFLSAHMFPVRSNYMVWKRLRAHFSLDNDLELVRSGVASAWDGLTRSSFECTLDWSNKASYRQKKTDAKLTTKSRTVLLNWNLLNVDLNEETAILILKKNELIDSPSSRQSILVLSDNTNLANKETTNEFWVKVKSIDLCCFINYYQAPFVATSKSGRAIKPVKNLKLDAITSNLTNPCPAYTKKPRKTLSFVERFQLTPIDAENHLDTQGLSGN